MRRNEKGLRSFGADDVDDDCRDWPQDQGEDQGEGEGVLAHGARKQRVRLHVPI